MSSTSLNAACSRAQRLLHDAVVFQAREPGGVLAVGMPKRMNARMPRSTGGADLVDQAIDAELVVARHRRDLFLTFLPGRTNSGRMKSCTDSEVSRTRSRRTG